MNSVLDEFKIFNYIPHNIKQKIKLFHVFHEFAVCVTSEDEVFALGDNSCIKKYFGYEYKDLGINYVSITELCKQKIENIFCSSNCVFVKSCDNKIFGSGYNKFGLLARGYRSDKYLKPERIEFFDNKNIIDISFGSSHCLALSSEGLVYGWGDNTLGQFDHSKSEWFLRPFKIKHMFLVKNKVKHIHCWDEVSVFVTFDNLVYVMNADDWGLKYKLSELSDVYKIYLYNKNAIVLKNNGIIEYFAAQNPIIFESNYESLVNSHLFSNKSGISELIFKTTDKIQIINLEDGKDSYSNEKTTFEYCLFKCQLTFTTIHLKDDGIYYKCFEIQNYKKILFETIKRIDFNVEEYNKKFINQQHSIIKKFNILDGLPEIFQSKVRFYYQIGKYTSDYYSAFFVMNDNKVYGIGYNSNGILGLGHDRVVDEYTIIHELCNQNIEEFFGGPFNYNSFMFGRNNTNQIFSWGHNNDVQVSNGYGSSEYNKPRKIDFFEDKNIIEISCGSKHFLGLSEDGCIYGWGNNHYGQTGSRSSNDNICSPNKIQLCDSEETIFKFINCSTYTSSAVTVDGRAYLWGKINENRINVPILIEENVSKMCLDYFGMSNIAYILSMNRNLSLKENGFKKMIIQESGVDDICGSNTILKDETVHKIIDNNRIEKTIYSNFYEYFLYEMNIIRETIHITSDGYLMIFKLQLISSSSEKILKKLHFNIFSNEFEKKFRIINYIGEGGFGVVNKVQSVSNSSIYAIKMMKVRGDLRNTLREIKIMSLLNSEYVVKYYNSWTEAKFMHNKIITCVYIQMEFCSQNLENIIELIDVFNEDKFKAIKYFIRSEILVEIIECLNHLHLKNIIHRDLKPRNIFISDIRNDRFLKLSDFGLSKVIESESNTRGVGTRSYMAPEVFDEDYYDSITDRSRYNLKSDIYSLGVIATKLFKLNEKIQHIRELKTFHNYSNYFTNTHLNENFSGLLKTISKMLSKLPEHRLSCAELMAKTHEWTVDPNIIKSDEYVAKFISLSENREDLNFFMKFLLFKLKLK